MVLYLVNIYKIDKRENAFPKVPKLVNVLTLHLPGIFKKLTNYCSQHPGGRIKMHTAFAVKT